MGKRKRGTRGEGRGSLMWILDGVYPLVISRVQVPSPVPIFLVTQEIAPTLISLPVTSSIDYPSRYSLHCGGLTNFIVHDIPYSNNKIIIKFCVLVPVLMLGWMLNSPSFPAYFTGTTGYLFP